MVTREGLRLAGLSLKLYAVLCSGPPAPNSPVASVPVVVEDEEYGYIEVRNAVLETHTYDGKEQQLLVIKTARS